MALLRVLTILVCWACFMMSMLFCYVVHTTQMDLHTQYVAIWWCQAIKHLHTQTLFMKDICWLFLPLTCIPTSTQPPKSVQGLKLEYPAAYTNVLSWDLDLNSLSEVDENIKTGYLWDNTNDNPRFIIDCGFDCTCKISPFSSNSSSGINFNSAGPKQQQVKMKPSQNVLHTV